MLEPGLTEIDMTGIPETVNMSISCSTSEIITRFEPSLISFSFSPWKSAWLSTPVAMFTLPTSNESSTSEVLAFA